MSMIDEIKGRLGVLYVRKKGVNWRINNPNGRDHKDITILIAMVGTIDRNIEILEKLLDAMTD
jgi:hypothetical protein